MKIRVDSSQDCLNFACVLIPTAGRPDVLMKTLAAQSFLNRRSTYVGIHENEWNLYRKVRREFDRITYVQYLNPGGSTVVARENLRRTAVKHGYLHYVCADDNTQFTAESLRNLVSSAFAYRREHKELVVVGGMQGSLDQNAKPSRFDEAYVKKSGFRVGKFRFYRKIGMMFWCWPHELYSEITYLPERTDGSNEFAGCMEDHSAILSALDRGFTNFVICMNAPFKKKRFQPGGQGDPVARARKIGQAWIRLGAMYPWAMSEVRMLWPYAKLFKKIAERSKTKKRKS